MKNVLIYSLLMATTMQSTRQCITPVESKGERGGSHRQRSTASQNGSAGSARPNKGGPPVSTRGEEMVLAKSFPLAPNRPQQPGTPRIN